MSKVRLIGGNLVPLVKHKIAPRIKVLDIYRPSSIAYLSACRHFREPIVFPKTEQLFIRHPDHHYFYYTSRSLSSVFPSLEELYLYNVSYDAEPLHMLGNECPDFEVFYAHNNAQHLKKYNRLTDEYPETYTQLDEGTYEDTLKEFEQFEEIDVEHLQTTQNPKLLDKLGDQKDYEEIKTNGNGVY